MFYTNELFWKSENPFLTTTESAIIERLENNLPTFEVTGDSEAICRLYFDIDSKIQNGDFNPHIDDIIKETGKRYIQECVKEVLGFEPNIAIATSSYEKKYSWRYFVNNIKMKKNEMGAFITKMNEYIDSKDDIFDYIERPKDGLFDLGIYDHNRKMRCINTSKPGENRPLVLVEGKIEDTLITGNLENASLATYYVAPKIKIPTSHSPTSVSDNSVLNNSHSELLKIVGNKGHSRALWVKLCGWFVNHSTKDKFLDFVDKAWRDEAEKMFDSMVNSPRDVSIYALDNIAKNINLTAYKEWRAKYNKLITIEILNKGSNDVAQFIAPRLKQVLVYCDENWIEFDKLSCLWRSVKKPDATIISHLQREIDEARESVLARKNRSENEDERKKLTELEKAYSGMYSQSCNCGYVSQIKNFLTTYLYDVDFTKNLDNHPYKLAFKNGMLDLKTLQFRDGLLQDDYLTKTIPHNYVKKQDNDKDVIDVKKALKKICNWNDAHLDYYLSCFGYAMTGDSNKEQMFWYFRGQTAENGKSSVLEALEKIMPNYVTKGTNTFLDKGVELKKEVPTWKGKRIVWLNELSTKLKDEDIVKSICDGTDFKYNRNYATEAEKVPIEFKLFVVSNNSLNIKGDAGIKRRFKLCQFNAQFQEKTNEDSFETLQFKKDKAFGDNLCGIYRDALLHLILNYSKKYATEKSLKPYPKEWNEEAEENMADNNKFETWFHDNFDVGTHLKCSRLELEANLPAEFKNVKIRDELTRMKVAFTYDSTKDARFNGKKARGIYFGFGKKVEESEEKK